jgi:hypothetical protein
LSLRAVRHLEEVTDDQSNLVLYSFEIAASTLGGLAMPRGLQKGPGGPIRPCRDYRRKVLPEYLANPAQLFSAIRDTRVHRTPLGKCMKNLIIEGLVDESSG